MTGTGPIDPAALDKLLAVIGGDTEDLQELIADFNGIAGDLNGKIQSGVAAADWHAVRIAAHTLKSNARDFGATSVAALCQTLEQQLKDGGVAAPEPLLAQLDRAVAEARAALDALGTRDA